MLIASKEDATMRNSVYADHQSEEAMLAFYDHQLANSWIAFV
jgi:hypothetical protein